MPIYAYVCGCGHEFDYIQRIADRATAPCPKCRAAAEHVLRPAAVIQDSIEGGLDIRHGLCWPDGTPRRFYSKSEIRAAEKASGWTNAVEHIPTPGSDKSPHTSRWV